MPLQKQPVVAVSGAKPAPGAASSAKEKDAASVAVVAPVTSGRLQADSKDVASARPQARQQQPALEPSQQIPIVSEDTSVLPMTLKSLLRTSSDALSSAVLSNPSSTASLQQQQQQQNRRRSTSMGTSNPELRMATVKQQGQSKGDAPSGGREKTPPKPTSSFSTPSLAAETTTPTTGDEEFSFPCDTDELGVPLATPTGPSTSSPSRSERKLRGRRSESPLPPTTKASFVPSPLPLSKLSQRYSTNNINKIVCSLNCKHSNSRTGSCTAQERRARSHCGSAGAAQQ